MVFIPTEHRYFNREYYKAYQKANGNVQPLKEGGESQSVGAHARASHPESELKAHAETLEMVKRRRERRHKKTPARQFRPEKKDIIAARLRGGLIQYMLKMGYPMDQALLEANRAVAQMIKNGRLDEDAASRQVFLSQVSGRPLIANGNQDLMAEAVSIATRTQALVDFDV